MFSSQIYMYKDLICIVPHCKSCQDITFSYPGQKNPTGSVMLDFSVWYCLSGTHIRCVSFKLVCRAGVREI